MDELNKRLLEWSESPVGSILIFVLFYLIRIWINVWNTNRQAKKAKRRKAA